MELIELSKSLLLFLLKTRSTDQFPTFKIISRKLFKQIYPLIVNKHQKLSQNQKVFHLFFFEQTTKFYFSLCYSPLKTFKKQNKKFQNLYPSFSHYGIQPQSLPQPLPKVSLHLFPFPCPVQPPLQSSSSSPARHSQQPPPQFSPFYLN